MKKVELRMNEEHKYIIVKKFVEEGGNKKTAAYRANVSVRQFNRLIRGYNAIGKQFFVHGNRGRRPKHALTNEFKDNIEELYITKYPDCTYTLFTELLRINEDINLSIDEVRCILRERYITSPRSHKKTKRQFKKELYQSKEAATSKKEKDAIQANIVAIEDAHPRQPRSTYFGEEVQMDACNHPWFQGIKTTLHAAIDDATGQVLGAYFEEQETLNGYYNVFHQILTKYGIPYLFKTDKRTVFEYNKKGTNADHDNTFTQFSYACKQLGTEIETSSVPQFKPRIERLFESFQSRLVPLLRLGNVTTIEEANKFIREYLPQYNEQFALPIKNSKSVFENQPSEEEINLFLSVLSRRTIDSGHSIAFKNKHYRLLNRQGIPIYFGKGTKCMVIESFNKNLYATVENNIFAMEEIPKQMLKSFNFDDIEPEPSKKRYIPNMMHPWKRKSFEKFVEKMQAS